MADKRKPDVQSIGQAIREMLNTYQINIKFDEATVIDSWEALVGKPVARQTKKIYIRNKVLFVEFLSASVKHDFQLHKAEILEQFKKKFGGDVLTEIVIM
jgi:predicted nucleic acid-binding Zn ribbon protein